MPLSDLQLSLAAAGAVLVAAVWGYNLLQERKHRRIAERIFGEGPAESGGDPLAGTGPGEGDSDFERVEPMLSGDPGGEMEGVSVSDAENITQESSPDPDGELVDPFFELSVAVDAARPLTFLRLREFDAALAERMQRPRRWLAVVNGEWVEVEDMATTGETRRLRCILQLADRRGATTAADIGELATALRDLAEEHGGSVQPVDVATAAAAAHSLDERCAATDVQIALHLMPGTDGGFPAHKVAALLGDSGLGIAADGNYHQRDAAGNSLFSVASDGAVPFDGSTESLGGLAFWLDVPRVANGTAAFERMAQLAATCSERLGGAVVDDQRRKLGMPELAGIARKIAEIQEQMAVAGFPAGGKRALRLFA